MNENGPFSTKLKKKKKGNKKKKINLHKLTACLPASVSAVWNYIAFGKNYYSYF
jgi:hypothetical protein